MVENRETGTSGRNVRREWEVCAFVERPRRKINHESVKKSWWRPNRIVKNKKDKRDQVEWVLVVRGRTVDFEERNGYGTGIGGGGKEEIRVLQQKQLAAMRNQVQVLRSREQKRVLGREEAEVKMGEMCRDMFCLVEGKEEESDDDCSINEESEDEDEDMDIKD